jgi:hypothetical protein
MYTYLTWTQIIYIWFPGVLERNGPSGGCSGTELAPPSTALDITENITIAAYVRIIVGGIVINVVAPASDEFPAGAAVTSNFTLASTLPHGYIKVPCYDETVAAACIEDTFWGGTTNELSCCIECKGGDAKTVTRAAALVDFLGKIKTFFGGGD